MILGVLWNGFPTFRYMYHFDLISTPNMGWLLDEIRIWWIARLACISPHCGIKVAIPGGKGVSVELAPIAIASKALSGRSQTQRIVILWQRDTLTCDMWSFWRINAIGSSECIRFAELIASYGITERRLLQFSQGKSLGSPTWRLL